MSDIAFDPADILGDRLVENGTEIIGEAWPAAVAHLQAIRDAGWRLVRSDDCPDPDAPLGECGCSDIRITEEWKP